MEIREYKTEFKNDIAEMILKIQQEEYSIPIKIEDQPDLANIETFYMQEDGNFWVYTHEGEIVGTLALKNIENGNAILRKMFVKKEYRGKEFGIAKKLLDKSIEWAREKNFSKLFLGTTEKFLAAHRFYEKNGFQEIMKKELPPNFPIMAVDKKFYRYDVV